MKPAPLFHSLFVNHNAPKTLVLLHGTGADEHDLLPLVDGLKDRYNFFSLRGNVDEQGMLRFFRRFSDGTFDQENIQEEVEKMSQFLRTWCQENKVDETTLSYLGYSNGANMILALLFSCPELVARAVLLHCLLPLVPEHVDLSGKQFLISYGEADQMITAKQTQSAIHTLQKFGADVSVVTHPGGHEIRQVEKQAFEAFL